VTTSGNGSADGLAEAMIQADGVTRDYDGGHGRPVVHALRGVDLTAGAGELVCIRGRSGSGKTTLLNLLGGLDRPTAGTVRMAGREVTTMAERDLVDLHRSTVAYIFQTFGLLPILSAAENVEVPLRLVGTPGRARDARVLEVLGLVGLAGRAGHRPHELSGGEQQRVAVARALASKPHIIFADEPTGNLDSRTGAEILAFMRQAVRELGQTIVMVTHDPVAASYSDRAVFLADGHIVDEIDDPTADSVFTRIRTLGEV
jgi:putative ABC transport system ATP-binding protein